MIDRYEIGERQTSACAVPTEWLQALELTLAPPDVRRARRPHAAPHVALAAAVDVLHVRLPRAVRAAVGAGRRRRRVRDRDRHRPPRRHRAHRPRRAARAAGRRRARLAAGALATRTPIQPPERAPLARARGAPAGHRRRDGALDRPALHPRRLLRGASRPATSCASASARSGPAPRQGADRAARRRSRPAAAAATRATGSPISCAAPSRTACSSPATPPGTACR